MSVLVSYESLGRDGLAEIADRALAEAAANLGDPNADARKARKVTIEISLTPKAEERGQSVKVSYQCKASLAAVKPVVLTAALNIAPDGAGSMIMNEIGTNPFQAELPIKALQDALDPGETATIETQTGGKLTVIGGAK